ncbi:MAG: efflux RND transporter permease subunit [Alphaproteobacteria bacterium]|nr:efflux RND transporter permease subunit [Alphaproteobacteria bacterium]
MNFSSFFIKRPRFAIVIALVMILFGLMSLIVLPVSEYPQITPPQILVKAVYPGANASTIMNTVAIPIENAVNGVENMLYMSSTSDDNGLYQLTITFNIGTDADIAQVKVENRLQQINSILPEVVMKEGLTIKTQSSNILGMIVLRSPNNTYDNLYLSNFAYTNIQNPLSRVNGVSDVNIYGPQNSIRVWMNPLKMASIGLSSQDIIKAISNQNIQAGVGSIGSVPSAKDTNLVLSLMAYGQLNSVSEFENIIVATGNDGAIVRLKDVAKVEIGADSYTIQSSFNNSPSVIIGLSQTPNSNSLQVMQNLKKEMERLKSSFPEDMEFEVVYDSTKYVRASIEGIVYTLFLTFILVVLVVYIFLQNPWATLIPTITIPVSLIATFTVIYLLGFNINILTLFAMILAIGLVVDDAIVVVERVEYLMETENLDSVKASEKAMEQISGAVVATTLVLLSIFIPVGLMAGLTGEIYKQFAVTIATAVSFSSINALTLSPALCAIFLSRKYNFKPKFFIWFDNILEISKKKYLIFVEFFCTKMKISLIIIFSVIIGIYYLFQIVPTSFIPQEDQGLILTNIQLSDNASLNQTKKILADISDKALSEKGVDFFIGISGTSFASGSGENIGMGVIGLSDWDKRTSKKLSQSYLEEKFRTYYKNNMNANIDFYSLPSIPGVGNANGLTFQLNAFNQSLTVDDLHKVLEKFLYEINKSPIFNYAFSGFTAGTSHILVNLDRTKLESLNVPVSTFFNVLQATLGSSYVNNITSLGQINKVIVQSDFSYRKNFSDVENIYIKSNLGKLIQVKEVATLSTLLVPKIFSRFNQYLSASITAATKENISTGEAIKEIQNMAKKLGRDYSISWTGLSLQEVETQGLIVILIALAFIFGYLFLVALYESWLVALSVMFSNIFAIIGALIGLLILDLPLSIYAQLGIVLLIGLASKNAILIVEFTLDYRKKGYDILKSALTGAGERFRAVLMTAFTFILGVFPMVVAKGAGAASQVSMGTSVFFGMIFATSIGVVFIPVLFAFFDKIIDKFSNKKN